MRPAQNRGLSRALRLAVSLVTASACGCGGSFTASDGQVFVSSGDWQATAKMAVINSAAHDLPCPRDQVRFVTRANLEGSCGGVIVLEGCGERATYLETWGRDLGREGCVYIMTGRVKLGAAPAPTPDAPRRTP
jgi:hypothetical protein